MPPDACPSARTGQPPLPGAADPTHEAEQAGSSCWLSTGRYRRTGNLPITERSPQHKAAFRLLILLAQYPARVKHISSRGSRNTLVEFHEYRDGFTGDFRVYADRSQPISLVPLCAM